MFFASDVFCFQTVGPMDLGFGDEGYGNEGQWTR